MNILKLFKKCKNEIPICYFILLKDKFKIKKQGSCELQIHPVIKEKLIEDEQEVLRFHVNSIADLIRDKIDDIEEL